MTRRTAALKDRLSRCASSCHPTAALRTACSLTDSKAVVLSVHRMRRDRRRRLRALNGQYAGLAGLGWLREAGQRHSTSSRRPLGLLCGRGPRACGAKYLQLSNPFPNRRRTCVLDTFFDPRCRLRNLVGVLARDYPQENFLRFGATTSSREAYSKFSINSHRFELPTHRISSPTHAVERYVVRTKRHSLILEKKTKMQFAHSPQLTSSRVASQGTRASLGRYLALGRARTRFGSPAARVPSTQAAVAIQQPSPPLASHRFDAS